jgi:hypothetical protein
MTNNSSINWEKIGIKDLGGLISETLRQDNIEAVLVGGACVSIYSENKYMSYDLDFITYEDRKTVGKSLKKLGFTEKGKYFQHVDCPFLIELVSPPAAVGKETIHHFQLIPTAFGLLKLLQDIDCVKDRLASFYHWSDKQSLKQAIEVCLDRKINMEELKRWSIEEGFEEKFSLFLHALKRTKHV